MTKRPDWLRYFMNIAQAVATRATCDRKHVGALIIYGNRILATGYNGSIATLPHCDEVGHQMEDGHCVRTIHAEANALLQAAKHGIATKDADMVVTASPCFGCMKLIAQAGILRVYYGEAYRDTSHLEQLNALGVDLVHIKPIGE